MAFETVLGYCWPQSSEQGGEVALHLSSPDGAPVAVEVARVGLERTVVWSGTIDADFHPTPLNASAEGCGWPAATNIAVGDDWGSGYYEVLLTVQLGVKSRVSRAFFVVRPSADSDATILLQLATNTWHAYNDFGGKNLYTGGVVSSLQRPMSPGYLHKPPGAGRRVTSVGQPDPQSAAHVGYLRLNRLSPWAGSAGWPDWEHPFLAWAEREGYQIDVCLNSDLEDHPKILDGYKLMLSVGHDEYWSGPMRDTVEGFIAGGGNAAFLSGNTSLWQVRLEDQTPEGQAATMVGYKGNFKKDPLWDSGRDGELTTLWSDRLLKRPENLMTGVSFTRGGYHRIGKRVTRGAGGYTIHRADHWLFDGTGLGYGDVLGSEVTLVGYECDGCDITYRNGLPYPTGSDGTPETFEILGTVPAAHFTRETSSRPTADHEASELEFITSRVTGERYDEADSPLAHGHAVLGTYTSPGGGVVVTSGSTDWAHGLEGRDAAVEQITRNLLDRLS